jgi:subtilase family serine protease
MRRLGSIRTMVVGMTVACLAALGTPGIATAHGRVMLSGDLPLWARAVNARGPASPAGRLDLQLMLGWRNATALATLAKSVSDPRNADYAHFLSPAQFRSRFSPGADEVAQVRTWLQSQGLRVTSVPASRLWVEASGTVAQVNTAFATRIETYRVAGRTLRAPAVAPSIPASLQGIASAVLGLDDETMQPASAAAPPPLSFSNATPCSAYWGEQMATDQPDAYGVTQPYSPCGYTPQQIRSAYGVSDAIAAGDDGSGVTVAIVDAFADPRLVTDLQTYSTNHSLPAPSISVQEFLPRNGSKALQEAWYGEQALDVDAVHSLAPGAAIAYVGARSSADGALKDAIEWVLDNHAADLISDSWGGHNEGTRATRSADTSMFEQAAAEGIGVFFSSGDNGDLSVQDGHPSVSVPANNPWVTAVGGSSLAVGSSGEYLFETGWGTSRTTATGGLWQPDPPGDHLYGAGGGTSKVFDQPGYQMGVVPSGLAFRNHALRRVVPDIAAVADPTTGFVIGQTQRFPDGTRYGEYRIGGTSLACPLIAAIMALAQQQAGHALGFVNPALYEAYTSDASIVHDVVDPPTTVAAVRSDWVGGDPSSGQKTFTLRTMNTTQSLHTTSGYDDVTGIGTPNGSAFLDALGPPPA